jgi:hypothetical protein
LTRPPLAGLAALGLALAGCGAAGAGGATHVASSWPAAAHATAGPPTMPVVTPAVRPLEIAGAPPAPGAGGGSGAPAPVRLRIPAIGVDSGLARLGLNADGTIQVPPDSGQAGWYAGGPAPGQAGPAVILGHLDSYTGPAVFYRLSGLRPGDGVRVSRDDGSELRFVVQRVATFPVEAFPTDQVYGVTGEPALRLITCAGTFDVAQRRYQSNVVVFAALTG